MKENHSILEGFFYIIGYLVLFFIDLKKWDDGTAKDKYFQNCLSNSRLDIEIWVIIKIENSSLNKNI